MRINHMLAKKSVLALRNAATRIGSAVVCAGLVACAETNHQQRQTEPVGDWITTQDSWVPTGTPTASLVGEQLDLQATLGVAISNHSIFSFDGMLMRVTVLDSLGEVRTEFGREGDGPGEFRPPRRGDILVLPPGATAQWLSVRGDSVAAFDGRRFQIFSRRGEYRSEPIHARSLAVGGGPYFSSRIQLREQMLLVGIEHQGNRTPTGRGFTLWRIAADSSATALFSMTLPEIPQNQSGGIYRGPRQAAPLWDAHEDRLVVSDGASPFLLLGKLSTGITDTFSITLPEREPRTAGDLDSVRRQSGMSGEEPDPSAPKRIRQLTIAPDGWVWLEPVQPRGLQGVEVILVHPGRGIQRTDTVPFFPSVFADPRSYLAVQTGTVRGYRMHLVKWASSANE